MQADPSSAQALPPAGGGTLNTFGAARGGPPLATIHHLLSYQDQHPPDCLLAQIEAAAGSSTSSALAAAASSGAVVLDSLLGRSHAKAILCRMNVLRKRGTLCDVTLRVAERNFPAHKIVLAACSDYFCAMFTGGMTESEKEVIEIKGVSADVMEVLLDFVYTETVDVTMDNVQELLPAASLLQLEGVKAACSEFLEQELDPANCLGVARFAELHSCSALRRAAQLYSSRHFEDVAQSEEFLSLQTDELLELLAREDLQVDSEETVFHSLVRWVRAPLSVLIADSAPSSAPPGVPGGALTTTSILGPAPARVAALPGLLAQVRLATLSARFLTEIVDNEPLLRASLQCRDVIDEAKRYHLRPDLRHELSAEAKYRARSGADEFLVVIGGFGRDQTPIDSVELFNPRTGEWSELASLPRRYRYVAAAAIRSRVYVIGGFDGRERLNTVAFMDLQEEPAAWRQAAPMAHRRGLAAACAYQGLVYVCGGFDGSARLRSLEAYDSRIDEWRLLPEMSTAREGAGLVVAEDCLYCLGGYDGMLLLSSMERYDPRRGAWAFCEPMGMRRSGAGVAVVGDTLYVCGGYGGPEGSGPVHLDTVEAYNARLDQWSLVSCMNMPRCYVGACQLNGKIFVAAGYDGNHLLDTVESYEPLENTWTLRDDACMQHERCDTGMCVVRLK